MADSLDDPPRLVRQGQEIAGHVDDIDGLDEKRDAELRQSIRRPGQILDEDILPRGGTGAGHGMELAAAIGLGIADGGGEGGAEIIRASCQRAQTALAGIPITRRQVHQHHLHPGALRRRRHLLGRMLVGEGELDGGEAGGRGGLEALEEGDLGEHEGEIGAELRHEGRALKREGAGTGDADPRPPR